MAPETFLLPLNYLVLTTLNIVQFFKLLLPGNLINSSFLRCWRVCCLNVRQPQMNQKTFSNEHSVTTGVPQGSLLGPLLFLIYFNDFPECLKFSRVIMYADDTVVYFAHKDKAIIEDCLNEDFKNISKYLEESELIINLKEGKTESMLFATSKKLSKIDSPLNIKYREVTINNTNSYEYLGNQIDQSALLTINFEKRYRKASGRIRLLQRVRQYLTVEAAEKIFNMMIVPLLTYCCLLKLPLTKTQTLMLSSLRNRASSVIYGNDNREKKIVSILHHRQVKSCVTVRKCLDGTLCSSMKEYFQVNKHSLGTRNQNCILKLPKLRLELGRQTFAYSGAKLYNDLPTNIRKEENILTFTKYIKTYNF